MTLATTYNQTVQEIYDFLKDDCELAMLDVQEEEDACHFVFPVLSEGVKGVMRVVCRPGMDVFLSATAPFNIDVRALPIARIWANNEHYSSFYANPEIDERDGEVRITTLIPHTGDEGLPASFRPLFFVTVKSLINALPTLNRFRTCDFTPEEIQQFRDEAAALEEFLG